MVDGTNEPSWQPLIVDPARRAAITSAIIDIVTGIEAWRRDHTTTSDDDADYATLRIYTSTDETMTDPDDETGRALSDAIAKLGDRQAPGLYGGAARVAFAVGHLSAGDDADLACEMIERSLLNFLSKPTEVYDLISGLVGIAVPVLQRIADSKPSPVSEPLARNILDQLARLARPMDTGIAWFTPPELLPAWQREIAPEGYTNLGLAHGVPGVVAILARYVTAGVDAARAQHLLEGAVAYLRSVAGPRYGARYPAWLPSRPDASTRVAWCYGDLGVSVALLAAATAAERSDWRDDALELARGMADRSFETSQVNDAGLCHGAAGVAHLFNRLAQATGDTGLAAAAERWFDRTLAIRRDDAIGGFPRAMPSDGTVTWEPDADLLNGAAGVALALHAAISPIEPAWDQLLLADLSPSH